MRYFLEDKTQVNDFSEDKYKKLAKDTNSYKYTPEIVQERKVNKTIDVKKGEVKYTEIQPQIVKYTYYGEYAEDETLQPPADYPNNFPYPLEGELKETVTIVKELTEEEKEERQRKIEEQEEIARKEQEFQTFLHAYLQTEEGQLLLQTYPHNDKSNAPAYLKIENEKVTVSETDETDINSVVNVQYLNKLMNKLLVKLATLESKLNEK